MSRTLNVLIVDDEPLLRWSLAQTLTDCGDSVIEAGNKETAVRALASADRTPDVVLLDYDLPDSADLGLLSTVKRLAPKSRVIFMTADCPPEVLTDALRMGADRVLIKPIDMHSLATLLHHTRSPQIH